MFEQPKVIYEDRNFLALYKPAGLLVHGLKTKNLKLKTPTLVAWLLKRYPEIKNVGDSSATLGRTNWRPGIVHRLDKDTSGVILVARNQKYFEYLKKLFQTGQIKKTYLALAWGRLKPKTGVIKRPISLKRGAVKRTVWKGKLEKEAITEYKVLKYYNFLSATFSLLKVWPKTGRTHQIRIHLASIGHPIVGDSLYGRKNNHFNLQRQFLHAESLEFSLGNGRRIKIEVGLPKELKTVLTILTGRSSQ